MDLDRLRAFAEHDIPFNRFLGLKVRNLSAGQVTLEMPWRDELIGDPVRRALHGGVISMLADTAGGIAVWSAVEDEAARVSTIDLRIDYVRPGQAQTLLCAASVVRLGGRVGVTDMRLFHPEQTDVTVATGKGVYSVVVPKSAQ